MTIRASKLTRDFRCALAIGLGLSSLLSISESALAATVYGSNLIINGNAESGPGSVGGYDLEPIPSWTISGNFTVVQYGAPGFPSLTIPDPTQSGINFFAGGPNNASSSISQRIDISDIATSVDTGSVGFIHSGYFGGFSSQGDNAALTANFISTNGTLLSSLSVGNVSNTERQNTTAMLFRSEQGYLPVGTRSIELLLTSNRFQGSYNDGYADNLSFALTPIPIPGAVVLLGSGLMVLFGFLRRKPLEEIVGKYQTA